MVPAMSFAEKGGLIARLEKPRVERRVSFAVVADPHVTPRADGTPMVYHRSAERFRAALADAERRGVDAVLSAGDLTKDGAPWEYECLDEILAGFDGRFISVPGNHDVPKASVEKYEYGDDHETPPVEQFERRYAPDAYPFLERIGGIDLLCLNTASQGDGSLHRTHDGAVTADEVAWLRETLTDASTPVLLMHHNTPAMYDQLRAHGDNYHPEMGLPPVFRDPDPLMEVLTDAQVPLVITGHLHNVGVAQTGPTWEVTTPATGSFPQAYLLLEIGPEGTDIRYVPTTNAEGMAEAHHARWSDGPTSAGYTSFASVQLASLPLVDEFEGAR